VNDQDTEKSALFSKSGSKEEEKNVLNSCLIIPVIKNYALSEFTSAKFVFFTIYYLGDQVKKFEMVVVCSMDRELGSTYIVRCDILKARDSFLEQGADSRMIRV
jgi:hypothetical protein